MTQAVAIEEGWLTGWLPFGWLSFTAQTYLPTEGAAHCDLGLPTPTIHQASTPIDVVTGLPDQARRVCGGPLPSESLPEAVPSCAS